MNCNTLAFESHYKWQIFQDLLNLDNDSRLNKPGTIERNWSWRLSRTDFNIKEALKRFGDLAVKYQR